MRWLIALALLLTASLAHARVDYAIDLTAPEHHTAQVSTVFPQTPAAHLDVKMPAWRTGRYQILDLAKGVRAFAAADDAGRALRWEKIDKSTWRIHLARQSAVRVSYELYANELGFRSRHIDDSHAYLNASAVLMYADRFRSDDVAVALKVPAGWNSVSGMRSTGKHRFVAENWDILTDSPIETGVNRHHRFQEGGRDYEVVIWGHGNYDAKQIVADFKKMVPQATTIWSNYPFRRYVFIVHATDGPGGGATEHRNSTVIQMPRYAFQPRGRYLGFLSTASHEFIHTWNVKAYRGAGLVPYDYQRENYSTLLWVAEGSTSYFEHHLLLRAGLMKPDEYFEALSRLIDGHRHRPGTAVQSVSEASFDAWISPSGDFANNASVDIYDQGQMVSWMLDIALIEQTGGRVSYRHVHDALYRRFNADRIGFSDADMLAILRELTGTSWEDWWQRNVKAPVSVDFARLLQPVGLRFAADNSPLVAWAGWQAEEANGAVRLTSVERGSPAWKAGFTPGDILVAFDGNRVTKPRFDAALGEYRPDARVKILYFRRDRLGEKLLTLGSAPKAPPKVVPVERPTAAQKALFTRWLLIPYPAG